MSRAVAHLTVAPGRATVEVHGPSAWRGEAEFTDAERLAEVVAGLADAGALPRGTRLRVSVEAPLLQVRRLEGIPPVNGSELEALVALHPGRYFRKIGKTLVTAAAWEGRGRKRALAVALETTFAEAIRSGAMSAGFRLMDIVPVGPALQHLSLLPPTERDVRASRRIRHVRRGLAVAALLWSALIMSLVWRTWRDARRVEAELVRLRAPVEAVLLARREVDAALVSIAAVERPATERFGPALTLLAAGRALPDSAWLTAVRIRPGGEGTVAGAAVRPSVYLARLDRMGDFPRIRADGRTTEEISAGRRVERFAFRFEGARR